jgi:hypothetical protein
MSYLKLKNNENSNIDKNKQKKNIYTNTIYDNRWKDGINHISCSVNPSNLVAPVKVNQKFNKRYKNNSCTEDQLLTHKNTYSVNDVYNGNKLLTTENLINSSTTGITSTKQVNLKSLYTLHDCTFTSTKVTCNDLASLRQYQQNAISSSLTSDDLISNKRSFIKNLVSPQYLSVKKYNMSKIK